MTNISSYDTALMTAELAIVTAINTLERDIKLLAEVVPMISSSSENHLSKREAVTTVLDEISMVASSTAKLYALINTFHVEQSS